MAALAISVHEANKASRPGGAVDWADTDQGVPGGLVPLLAGLDGLAHGMAIFDASGCLRYANAAARAVLARLGWCTSAYSSHSTSPEHHRRWSDALHRVCQRGLRELFELPGGATPGFAAMVPVATQGECAAFVTFGREELCGAIELQMFALRYGLTLAESQVLRQLCRGLKAAEIARAHGVSASTVLTQISAIRNKTLFASVRLLLDTLSRMPPLNPVAAMRTVD
jgi:hypothetical protein